MDCRVVVEAAVPVYDVETPDEAVRIAISKTGEMLNPDLNYVEIDMVERPCPHCGDDLDPAFVAADQSLVALELEMTAFNVERETHASRIARKEIGQRLENIPLEVTEVAVIDEEEAVSEETPETDARNDGDSGEAESSAVEAVDADPTGEGGSSEDTEPAAGPTDGGDIIPEFEDRLEE